MEVSLLNLVEHLYPKGSVSFTRDIMDADDASVPETPVAEAGEAETYEKQVVALQSYLDSVPYECESVEEMQAKLEYIVGKLLVCAKAKNWLVLSTWDGLLQWCVFLHA
jgi:proteasome activator subunit 4